MKNIKFDQLEQLLPEDDWLAGEALLADGALHNMRETERRLWLGRVTDGGQDYETEIHLTPSRIKAAACECDRYRATACCGHLVAMALSLRSRLADDAQKRAADARPPKPHTTTKQNRLKDLLSTADTAELHRFLLDYARRQPSFALALRAHLGSEASAVNYNEQSKPLLESALQAARQPNGRIGLRGAQQVARITEELLNYSQRQLALHNWVEASRLAQLLLERLPPVLRKVERGREAWLLLLQQASQVIDEVLDKPIAPVLREELMNWLAELMNKLTLRNWELDILLWSIWLKHSPPARDVSPEGGLLVQQYLMEGRSPSALFDSWYQYREAGFLSWLLTESLSRMGWRWPALAWFVSRQHKQQAGQLAAYHGVQGLPEPSPELEVYLLPALYEAGESKLLQFYLYQGLCQKLDKRYYQLLVEYQLAEADSLLEALSLLAYSGQKISLKAHIMADFERWDSLLELAQKYPQSDILLIYASPLLAHRAEAFSLLAEQWLMTYLKGHIGRKSALLVSQLLYKWRGAGAQALVERMLQYIRTNFPERHSLREELATLMP